MRITGRVAMGASKSVAEAAPDGSLVSGRQDSFPLEDEAGILKEEVHRAVF
jgi:hypothetical protein